MKRARTYVSHTALDSSGSEMVDEWRAANETGGRRFIDILSQHIRVGPQKNHEKLKWGQPFPGWHPDRAITRPEHYHYADPLCKSELAILNVNNLIREIFCALQQQTKPAHGFRISASIVTFLVKLMLIPGNWCCSWMNVLNYVSSLVRWFHNYT